MTPEERLTISAEALAQFNPDAIDAIDDMDAGDIAKISNDIGLKADQTPKLIGVMIYIRKRLVEKYGRVKAFENAFPERCIATVEDSASRFGTTAELGERLHKSTIDVKAKRLESSKLYLHVYNLLQTNLYVAYAISRMQVLDEALSKSLDPLVSDRDKPQFMKIFLDETRKPENAKQLEFNLNIHNNDVSIVTVEDKMNTIAQALNHASAAEVIELVHSSKVRDDNS